MPRPQNDSDASRRLDPATSSLRIRLDREPIAIGPLLALAARIAALLTAQHRAGVVVGALTPETILLGPDGEVRLAAAVVPPRPALYASPEQTGRINRAVDYRSDFYAFGVIVYEALTGAPPFTAADPLELMHAHIAKTAVPPEQVSDRIPGQLSRLVMKLLAKGADDRYQSGRGLQRDLERALDAWSTTGTIAAFPLGRDDVAEQFIVSQKLYGREREVDALLRTFNRVCHGGSTMLLVSGYSGIGKTSLIRELYKPIVRQRGHFITGKFDQVLRDIPYGAFAQALRSLVWQLLTESEDRLDTWRGRMKDALGANGGVLSHVVPEIELIVGPQPPPAPLDPVEARNRFGYVLQRFFAAMAGRDHPLVLFLDDLQWVDAATLDLLHDLVTAPDIRHLLVIGSFRDNEVDATHLLSWGIERWIAGGATIDRLAVGPLDLPSLTRFVGDTLHCEPGYAAPLATLIQQKTDGNPFFVIQFLSTLAQEGLIAFDAEASRWSYRLEDIAAAGMTDNVVDLMTRKIARLSGDTQRLLTLAACIGNQFDRDTLATVSGQPPAALDRGLGEAVDAGLLYAESGAPGGDGRPAATWRFLHDRVQRSAYDLIPLEQKKPLHLHIGRLLRDRDRGQIPDERLFAVINHLNIGSDLVTDPVERLALARLSLTAGRRAKASAAHRAGLDYLDKGIARLDDAWSDHHELLYALHLDAAECAYLTGDFDGANTRLLSLLARARTRIEQAEVQALRVTVFENGSRWRDAVSSGRAGLAVLGITFPDDPAGTAAALDAEVEASQRALAGRSIASLVAADEMVDPEMRTAMRILTIVWAPAYISGDELLARLISATMVRLSLTHGNAEDSAYGYVTHAITIGPHRGQYRDAYEWGALALAVNARFDDAKRRAKIHQQFQAHVNLWRRPFATCIPHAQEARRSGLETGDFTYAGYGAATEAWSAWMVTRDIERFVRDHAPTAALLQKVRMMDFHAAHEVLMNWARALQGRTSDPLSLSGGGFDEQRFIDTYAVSGPFFLMFLYAAKLHLAVLLDAHDAALDLAAKARAVSVTGTLWPVLVEFWSGMAAAGAWATASGDRAWLRDSLARSEAALSGLAEECPENFRAFWLLTAAELKRIDGEATAASALFDAAIACARQTENLAIEAFAAERAGRFRLERRRDDDGLDLIAQAHQAYTAWGATVKAAQLTRQFALRAAPLASPIAEPIVHDSASTALDMAAVLKVAQAIASEMESEGLLRRLMTIALENAGASRGLFVQEQRGQLSVRAEATADPADVRIGPPRPIDPDTHLAGSVVRYVHRTGQSVVVDDAERDEPFGDDPYLGRSRVRSILCVPVGQHGRTGGILYLENDLTAHAFTPDRIEIMRVLTAQTAIALENARLYEDMKDEVARRTAAEQALRVALNEVEGLKNRLEAENVYLQEEIRTQHNFNEIVGNSPALVEALRQVERVAPTDSTVMILGETGSGKELFARAIHSRSRRSGRPLVKVNCGAIAPGLVESELFGHVKGAFTGAIEKRVGRFEVADGGTIFLDEIGELPMEAQVKLLRVLQEQEFEPVGSSRTIRVSVRVIAATNRDLESAVREGRFRADLLYRLNVFPIRVPPLRERPQDIALLAGFFATGLARRLGKPIQGFSARSMQQLRSYGWPGNVRELQNIVERAAILAQGPILEIDDALPGTATAIESTPDTQTAAPLDFAASLDDVQRLHIISVLKQTSGVVEGAKGAAAILQMHPNTLRSRMKKLGIPTTFRSS